MIIRFRVFEQTLSIADKKSVPRKGSKDYLWLQFMFSSDWNDLDKVCYLQHGDVSQPIDIVDGLVEVPEWFTEQDSFDVTLFGKSGNQEVPTNVVALQLEKSNTLWEQDAPEPQPSWLAKVIDMNNHPPVPGNKGYWLLWDTDKGEYVESELPFPDISVGPQGPQGDTGPQGPKGDKVVSDHTTQADWTPDKVPALYTVIDVAHAGTQGNPIPAERGMEYVYGLYYRDSEDGKLYLCQRTGEAAGGTVVLQYMPHELVGHYFVEMS